MKRMNPARLRRGATAFLIPVLLCVSPALAWCLAGGPRTFNLYLRNYYEPGDTQILAKFDALGLDVDTPQSVLAEIRSYNPAIKLLAYIPINGTYERANVFATGSKWREVWQAAETNNWWLRNTQGDHIYDHPGKWTTNLTSYCPANGSGQKILDWFPGFVVGSILQNGSNQWDGVILDDVWVSISFITTTTTLNAYPIDADQDGVMDDVPTLNSLWKAGNDTITARTKRIMPAGKILIGNGANPFYHMNGAYMENFPFHGQPDPGHPLGYTWNDKMFGTYGYFNNETYYSNAPARLDVVNTKWAFGDRLSPVRTPEFERQKRFCLVSTMLRDGYFTMDWDPEDGGHASIWWETDYEKQIGTPTGPPYQATYNGMTLWRRDYTNGSVILNNNYTTFLGSPADAIPPIGWVDARVLLTSEMWRPETTPPGTITDLSVTRTWTNQVEIGWTNVGDDGSSGQAVEVQARYAAAPITDATWDAATVVSPGVIPELSGTNQKMIITGLASNQLYYFAARTRDLAGNWAAVSNSPGGTTVIGDTTPPAAITDLAVVSTTSTGATVSWTAPGDDGLTGTASFFDLRYATFPLSSSNFNSGAMVIGEPVPGPPGTHHELVLYGMIPNTVYYFAIRTGDEMPNWSTLSNLPSASTQDGDTTPPAAVTDLRVTGIGSDSVTLTWTAPGDDGMTGRATEYDMRESGFAMTGITFSTSNFVIGEPGPALPGTTQSFTVTGLGVGYTHYFALKTSDEFPNWSGMSNVVVATTNTPLPTDTTPPAAVTNLVVSSTGSGLAILTWSAPGDDGATGRAASYDLRYATVPITDANFGGAAAASGEPVPAPAGAAESFTVPGLIAETTYYFALKTLDEMQNVSPLSNMASGTTTAPTSTSPPLAPSRLLVTQSGQEVDLTWDPNAEPDLAGYRIYRCESGGSWALRQEPLITSTAWQEFLPLSHGGFEYRVTAVNTSGLESAPSAPVAVDPAGRVRLFSVPSPNPFAVETAIRFDVPAPGLQVVATVYDIRGRVVRQLFSGAMAEGEQEIRWDGRDNSGAAAPAGLYFLNVRTDLETARMKLVLAR